jgi:hypothetical protein
MNEEKPFQSGKYSEISDSISENKSSFAVGIFGPYGECKELLEEIAMNVREDGYCAFICSEIFELEEEAEEEIAKVSRECLEFSDKAVFLFPNVADIYGEDFDGRYEPTSSPQRELSIWQYEYDPTLNDCFILFEDDKREKIGPVLVGDIEGLESKHKEVARDIDTGPSEEDTIQELSEAIKARCFRWSRDS